MAIPDAAHVNLITRLPLRKRDGLERVLRAFEGVPSLAPTHWGPDERARNPYDRREALALLDKRTDELGWLGLRRAKAPRYDALVATANTGLKGVEAHFESALTAAQLGEVFALGDALAAALEPAFGFVHLVWHQGKSRGMDGASLTAKQLQKYGLRTLYTRNYLGPELAKRLGKAALGKAGTVEDLPWGGVRLDLAAPPWEADAAAQERARKRALAALAPSGLFGDYSEAHFEKPGPKWTPLAT